MPISRLARLAVFLLSFAAAFVPAREAGQPPVVIFAAASVSDVVREIGEAFTRRTGIPVRVSSGGSGVLGQQILKGAPADIFIPAAGFSLTSLQEAGLVSDAARFDWIANTLVVVAPADRAIPLASPEEIATRGVRHLAIGDPEVVPAGIYARQALISLGLWERVHSRLVPAADVRAALAYVESGEADLGIVYATDARISRRVRVVLALPEASHPPIRYPAALVTRPGGAPGAPACLDFLRSARARRILADSGFTPIFP